MTWSDPREAELWTRLAPAIHQAARARAGRQTHLIPELESEAWAQVAVLVVRSTLTFAADVTYFAEDIRRGCDTAFRSAYRWTGKMLDALAEAESQAHESGTVTVDGEKKFLGHV